MSLFDRASIGKEVWEELEELLISADVGVSTTEKLINMVKAARRRGKAGRLAGARHPKRGNDKNPECPAPCRDGQYHAA